MPVTVSFQLQSYRVWERDTRHRRQSENLLNGSQITEAKCPLFWETGVVSAKFWRFEISCLQNSAKDSTPCSFRSETLLLLQQKHPLCIPNSPPRSYIDTEIKPKQTGIFVQNNKANKCKCLCKECSIALRTSKLYISTGLYFNICKRSLKNMHSKQAPIHVICFRPMTKEKQFANSTCKMILHKGHHSSM